MSENSSHFEGNIVRDPELRYTPGGVAVTNFAIATNRRWRNQATNEWVEETAFIDCTAWKQLATNIVDSVRKGDRVTVAGRFQTQTWDQEGQKRSKLVLTVDSVGVSLRFATAVIAKNEKGNTGEVPVVSGNVAGEGGDFDEEPF